LQQQSTHAIHHEHRECPVQPALAVRIQLVGVAQRAVALVHQDDALAHYLARSR
jgi:hypothetical protein